jgi:hypothetical protein
MEVLDGECKPRGNKATASACAWQASGTTVMEWRKGIGYFSARFGSPLEEMYHKAGQSNNVTGI